MEPNNLPYPDFATLIPHDCISWGFDWRPKSSRCPTVAADTEQKQKNVSKNWDIQSIDHPDYHQVQYHQLESGDERLFKFSWVPGLWKLNLMVAIPGTTYHTHFSIPLGIAPGWWDDRKINHKLMLPIYLRLDISSNLSRALSCLRLSGHNFVVQRMRHNRNKRPYELRICDKCDWHSVQDEEHILLDCPH